MQNDTGKQENNLDEPLLLAEQVHEPLIISEDDSDSKKIQKSEAQAKPPKEQKLKDGVSCLSLATVYLTVFLDIFSWGILNPILPYLAKTFNASAFQVGILNSVYSFAQVIGAFVLGWMSDKIGRKPVLALCLFCSASVLISTVFVNSLWTLILARGIAGLFAGSVSTAASFITDVTLPAGRAQYLGYIGSVMGLALVLGPAAGGALGVVKFKVCPIFGYDNCIDCGVSSILAGGCNLLNFILCIAFMKETVQNKCCGSTSKTEGPTASKIKQNGVSSHSNDTAKKNEISRARYGLVIVFIAIFVANFAFCMWDATYPLYIFAAWFSQDTTQATIWNGVGFAVFGLTMSLIQFFFTEKAVKGIGARWTIFISSTLRGIAYLSMIFMPPGPIGVVIGLFITGASGALNYSAFQALLGEVGMASKWGMGAVMGFSQTTIALARATAPLIGGWLFDWDEYKLDIIRLVHLEDLYPWGPQYSDAGDIIFVAAGFGTLLVGVFISFLPIQYGAKDKKYVRRICGPKKGDEIITQMKSPVSGLSPISNADDSSSGQPHADV